MQKHTIIFDLNVFSSILIAMPIFFIDFNVSIVRLQDMLHAILITGRIFMIEGIYSNTYRYD